MCIPTACIRTLNLPMLLKYVKVLVSLPNFRRIQAVFVAWRDVAVSIIYNYKVDFPLAIRPLLRFCEDPVIDDSYASSAGTKRRSEPDREQGNCRMTVDFHVMFVCYNEEISVSSGIFIRREVSHNFLYNRMSRTRTFTFPCMKSGGENSCLFLLQMPETERRRFLIYSATLWNLPVNRQAVNRHSKKRVFSSVSIFSFALSILSSNDLSSCVIYLWVLKSLLPV